MPQDLDEFTRAYVEAALWSSMNDYQEPLDKNYTVDDIADVCLWQMVGDCVQFQFDNRLRLLDEYCLRESRRVLAQAGHDFWLTRNNHGSGFWDGDWSPEVADLLTEESHRYGQVDLYVGDDGKIYC